MCTFFQDPRFLGAYNDSFTQGASLHINNDSMLMLPLRLQKDKCLICSSGFDNPAKKIGAFVSINIDRQSPCLFLNASGDFL